MVRPATARRPPIREVADDKLRPFRDDVLREILGMKARLNELETAVGEGGDGGDGADPDATFVTVSAEAGLPNSRRLVNGTNTTVNTAVAGQISIDVPAGLTQEQIEDIAGNMWASTGSIVVAYDDLSGELSAEVQPLGVTTAMLAADAVTFAKIQNLATDRLIGRDTAGSGDAEEIAVTNGLAFTGSGSIGIANDGVTFARLQNISTDVLLGRDTAGSGDVEEIALGDGLQFSPSGTLSVDAAAVATRVIYSVDFTALASNTFVNGGETIDGLGWVCASTSNTSRTIFDIQNGTGLRWTAPTSSATAFDTASQTAAHIYIDLSSFTLWRPEEDLIVEIQYTGTFENGNDGFYFGLWGQANTPIGGGTSTIRMDLLNRVNSGGTNTLRTLHNATVGTAITDVNAGGTTDVVMGRFKNNGQVDGFFGTYSGGFPTGAYQASARQVTEQNAANPMMCQNTRLVLAFRSASDASPTSAVTITRLRLRRGI